MGFPPCFCLFVLVIISGYFKGEQSSRKKKPPDPLKNTIYALERVGSRKKGCVPLGKRVRARETAIKVPHMKGTRRKDARNPLLELMRQRRKIPSRCGHQRPEKRFCCRLRQGCATRAPKGQQLFRAKGSEQGVAAGMLLDLLTVSEQLLPGIQKTACTRQGASLPSDRNRARAEWEAARSPRPIP